jgi:hypothetical protein
MEFKNNLVLGSRTKFTLSSLPLFYCNIKINTATFGILNKIAIYLNFLDKFTGNVNSCLLFF